jgi:hypothetical protein
MVSVIQAFKFSGFPLGAGFGACVPIGQSAEHTGERSAVGGAGAFKPHPDYVSGFKRYDNALAIVRKLFTRTAADGCV